MILEAPLTAPDHSLAIALILAAVYLGVGTCIAAVYAAQQSSAYWWRAEVVTGLVLFWPLYAAWLVVSWPFKLLFNAVERLARRRIKR